MNLFYKFNFSSLILFFVVLAANCFLFFIPMIGQVGYENSVANSIIIFIVSGLFAISFFRKGYQEKNPSYIFIKNIKFFLAVLTVPLLFSIISTIIFSNCPITDGLWFYLILVVPTLFIGTASGYLAYFLSRKYSYMYFVLILFLLIFTTLLEFYRNPHVYFYNPVIGFFPGTIYDEDIAIDLRLIFYRITNLFFAAVILFAMPFFSRKKLFLKYSSAVILSILIITFYFLKPLFEFSTDDERLRDNLANKISTENFDIYYYGTKSSFVNPTLIALHHEYYYEQVLSELNLKPVDKIESYLFKSPEQKRNLFGAGNADVAKPWSGQIFMNIADYEGVLKHELVHIAAAEFGRTVFKVADGINNAMIEGLAMAVENDFDGHTIHYAAALANNNGYKINIETLFEGLNFFSNYSSVSYIYAGSFVKYLLDNYGIEKVKTLYGDMSFSKIFGKEISDLNNDFVEFIKNYSIEEDKNRAKLYFAGVPIFKKFCPRTAASEIKYGWELFSGKKYAEAAKIFSKVYSYSSSYAAITGLVNSNIELKNYTGAVKILSEELEKFRGSRYFFSLELLLADSYARSGDYKKFMAIYDSLESQRPHINYNLNVALKKTLFKISPDSLKYFLESETNNKFDMLFRLNNKSINYVSIPVMVDLSRDSSKLKLLCDTFKDKIIVNDQYSSYAAYKLSNAAELIGHFDLAKYFAVEALKFIKNIHSLHSLEQNLKRINWLINYSDELKPYFVYR